MSTEITRSVTSAPDTATFRYWESLLRPEPGEVRDAAEVVERIEQLLRERTQGTLLGSRGQKIDLTPSLLEGLLRVAEAVAAGQAVFIAPHDMKLTSQEAADLLHVSRPHLIKLLDRGELSYERTSEDPGAHRRLLLREVLEYKQRRRTRRQALLTEMTQDAEELEGGYR